MKTWRLKDVQIGGLEILNSADIHRLSGSKAGCRHGRRCFALMFVISHPGGTQGSFKIAVLWRPET